MKKAQPEPRTNQTFAVPKEHTTREETVAEGSWQIPEAADGAGNAGNVCSCPCTRRARASQGGFSPCIDPTAGSQQENHKHLLSQALLIPALGQATLQPQTEQHNIYGHSRKEWRIISQPCCSIYKPFSRKCRENGEKHSCKAAVKSHLQV